MKNLTHTPKKILIAWLLAGLLALAFSVAAYSHIVKETKAGHIDWSH